MNLDEVRSCLENDGWPVDVLSEVTVRSRFRSGDRVFPLFAHLEPDDRRSLPPPVNDGGSAGSADSAGSAPKPPGPDGPGSFRPDLTYATFAIIPFAYLPPDEGGDLLADRLLVLNREMN